MRQGKLILILLCLPILKAGTLPAALDFIYTRLPTPQKKGVKTS